MTPLEALIHRYGADRSMEYTGDIWGNLDITLTPAEVLALHQAQGWDEDGYAVRNGDRRGDATLVHEPSGITILRLAQ
jgi:hypothetical protein